MDMVHRQSRASVKKRFCGMGQIWPKIFVERLRRIVRDVFYSRAHMFRLGEPSLYGKTKERQRNAKCAKK